MDVKISLNENLTQPVTFFMDSLNFLNSYWQFFGVNVWMIKYDASSLTLELTNLRNVTIENCTFGNWAFRHVKHVMIQNSKSSILKHFPTSLNFYNSSGLVEKIIIKNLNFSSGLIIQDNSYIQILKSNFVNNTVNFGLIKVLNSSTLEMLDCTLQNNKAKYNAGTILTDRSIIYLTKSNFNGNEAIQGGGALHVREGSILYMEICNFSNNQVQFLESAEEKEVGQGGAILLPNSTANGINVNFTGNRANYGGGLFLTLHSKVTAQYMNFNHNNTLLGSAIYGFIFCTFSCRNCSLHGNKNVAVNNESNDILGAAVDVHNHSTINVSGFVCKNHTGYNWGCIIATHNVYL